MHRPGGIVETPASPTCKPMAKKPDSASRIADNKKAAFNYFFEERFEAGVVLQGWEVKALREGKVQLTDGYVVIRNGELFIIIFIDGKRTASGIGFMKHCALSYAEKRDGIKHPTAGSVDSQSVKTTAPCLPRADSMREKRSTGANGTFRLIRLD